MSLRSRVILVLATAAILIMPNSDSVRAQEKTQSAKSFRCTFPLISTGTWKKDGTPDAAVKAAKLILRFESINVDNRPGPNASIIGMARSGRDAFQFSCGMTRGSVRSVDVSRR